MNSEILDILSWKESAAIQELRVWYLDRFSSFIGGSIRRFSAAGEAGAEAIGDQLLTLPQESLLRIIAAPESFHCLAIAGRQSPTVFLAFLQASITAERCRLNNNTRSPFPVWTALGDAYFPPGNRIGSSSSNDVWMFGQEYNAPHIRGSVPVDFFSPHARSQPIIATDQLADFASAEVTAWFARLKDAAELIAATSGHAMYLMMTFLSHIALLKAPQIKGLDSFSVATYLGRATIVVASEQIYDVLSLADTLVHEAIHSYLYTIEMRFDFFAAEDERTRTARIASPWTGNQISLHSFIHACFVWFGLYHFWMIARTSVASANAMASTARNGFLGDNLTTLLPSGEGVNPVIRDLIGTMQQVVVSDVTIMD